MGEGTTFKTIVTVALAWIWGGALAFASWWSLRWLVHHLVDLTLRRGSLSWRHRLAFGMGLMKWAIYGLWLFLGLARLHLSPIYMTIGFTTTWIILLVFYLRRKKSPMSHPVMETTAEMNAEVHHGTV